MVTNDTSSDSQPTRSFYLPAMGSLARTPGRVAGFVTERLADRSVLVRSEVQVPDSRRFYTPAMAVLSSVPGRVERVVTRTLRNRDVRGTVETVREHVREFYLPATARRPD